MATRPLNEFSHYGIVWHVPHDATDIPSEVRDQFLLSDEDLRRELIAMTDHHTHELFTTDADRDGVVRHPVSRLVLDVERFEDDAHETMAAIGMGAVYTRTSDGQPLRRALRDGERQALIETYYRPHHQRLEDTVSAVLETNGKALVIDCHSFPSRPLPYEHDQSPERPEICIGADEFHTPQWAVDQFVRSFELLGFQVALNRPFAGALVPASRYRLDERVAGVMVEINRGLYLDESTGGKLPGFERFADVIRRGVWVACGRMWPRSL